MNVDGEEAGQPVAPEETNDGWRFEGQGKAGVADEFDYVMYGKVSIMHVVLRSWFGSG